MMTDPFKIYIVRNYTVHFCEKKKKIVFLLFELKAFKGQSSIENKNKIRSRIIDILFGMKLKNVDDINVLMK